MKKVFLVACVVALAGAASATQVPPKWARVYYGAEDNVGRDILGAGMDVCSGSAGEYMDVIASADELAGLQDMGYRIEVIAENAGAGFDALPPDMGLYHTYTEMLTDLQGYESTYPSLCKLYDVGDTWENRDMWVLKISDNPELGENEPKLFVVGCHHARELMTVELPLHFIDILLTKYSTDPDIKYYVDNYEIYIMPMANPDGHVYVENNSGGSSSYWWRKNRRDNGGGVYGVDLNRNYGYKWGYDNSGSSPSPSSATYRGPSAFSEPETEAVRQFMIDKNFKFTLDYHSYGEYILIPYGYDYPSVAVNPERDYFMTMGNGMNATLGNRFRLGTPPEILYAVNGGSIDYHYGEQTEKEKCYGICFELNTRAEGGFAPNETLIAPTVLEHEGPFLWLLEHMKEYVGVELAEFSGQPADGRAVLHWATASEYNHAGFNLYRENVNGKDASRVKVNDALIVGESPYRYADAGVAPGGSYDYYLEDVDLNGYGTLHGPAHVEMASGSKAAFALAQSYPNPARNETTVTFSLASAGDATVTIYDISGRKVAVPFAGAAKAGDNEVSLDVSTLAPGVYTYRLEAGGNTAARKLVVVE
ncbi:MAG: M14 family zinc carboxypeptidase [Candidatus Zixiibacteriota bacterium]|jgi:hypothetical protein